jgi:hypothetical protein
MPAGACIPLPRPDAAGGDRDHSGLIKPNPQPG